MRFFHMLDLCDAIDNFIVAREAQGLTPKSLIAYRERLNPFCKFLNCPSLHRVGPTEVDSYLVFLQRRTVKYVNNPYRPPENERLSPATIEGIKVTLKTFFNWCVERNHISESPCAHLRIKRFSRFARVRAMDAGNLKRMLAYAKLAALARNPIDIRDLSLLSFTADSLARVGEVSGLDVSNVDFNRSFDDGSGRLTFEAYVDGKVGPRLVTFSEQTALFMLDWLEVRPVVDHDSFFVAICRNHFREQHPRCTACRVFGRRMTTQAIAQAFKRLAKRVGIDAKEKVNPHAIRHLGGIVYAERAGIEIAQEKLGHTSIMTTRMHYVPQNRDLVRRATSRLSPVSEEPDQDQ